MRPKEKEDEIKESHSKMMQTYIAGKPVEQENKVNIVCESLKKVLVARNEANKYLLPILTIYVKKQPQ